MSEKKVQQIEEMIAEAMKRFGNLKDNIDFDAEVTEIVERSMKQFDSLTYDEWVAEGKPDTHDGHIRNIIKLTDDHRDVQLYSKAVAVARANMHRRVRESLKAHPIARLKLLLPSTRRTVKHNETQLVNALQMVVMLKFKQNLMERYEINDMSSVRGKQ